MKIVIPARKGSKGLPGKNRILLSHTLSIIPNELRKDVIITTNDEKIIEQLSDYEVLVRNETLSADDASIKDVLIDLIKRCGFSSDELVLMLYLTYPEREWEHVVDALKFFKDIDAKSLLCRIKPRSNPFLCMFGDDDHKGRQIVKHDLYRRQDYPECFELSHFISIFYANELESLNKNLYNSNTVFFKVNRPIDIDTPEDLRRYYDKDNS
tara:strand:- start:245 stop:877 length:633 start_codon:yes stop_codon:yes gene_type:complete